MEFSVNLWGTNPDLDNDDCWTGRDFATVAEALECFHNPEAYFRPSDLRDTRWIEFDGPGENYGRAINADRPDWTQERSDSWRREQAMEAGMLHGIDAYNDLMGY